MNRLGQAKEYVDDLYNRMIKVDGFFDYYIRVT